MRKIKFNFTIFEMPQYYNICYGTVFIARVPKRMNEFGLGLSSRQWADKICDLLNGRPEEADLLAKGEAK